MIDVSNKLRIERIGLEGKHTFFGYYDIFPENKRGDKVLLNVAPFNDHMPNGSDCLSVGYVDTTGTYHEVGETTGWNFQEGCRLQWVGDDILAYNVLDGDRIRCRIVDTASNREVAFLNHSIYHYSAVSHKIVTYNLFRSRYCYPHKKELELTDYDKDGLFVGNIDDTDYSLIISLNRLANDVGSEASKTWIEHAVFNPSGDKFYFFHRWESESGGFYTRFCVSDLQGHYTVLLDSGACSHAGWVSDSMISAWGRMPNKFNSIQKSSFLQKTGIWKLGTGIYHRLVKSPSVRQKVTNDAYILFDLTNGEMSKLENAEFTSDGHETWSKDSRYMLTDTYPDENNQRQLMLYDAQDDIVYELGKFLSYPEIKSDLYRDIPGIRCDLHPKWSYREQYVYFDSTHEGYRGLYRVDISSIKK